MIGKNTGSHLWQGPNCCESDPTRWMCWTHLSQEVLLRILMKGGHCTSWPKPSIDCDVIFISLTKTTVVRDTDVVFQLGDLGEEYIEHNCFCNKRVCFKCIFCTIQK
jgi:hypothetical protein